MKKSIVFVFGLIGLVALGGNFIYATEPQQWTVSTRQEFLQGDLKGVSVTSDGRLTLAPAFEQVLDTEQAYIYSTVADKAGNIYLGTGGNGKIFRLTAGGRGAEWAKLDEQGVHALALDSMNRVYAATSPEGKVYRLNGQGQPEVLFDPEEKYIWSLAIDKENNVFVGTGPKGIVYKVTPQGDGNVFYDSKETHIMSLEWDLNGNLLAGSAPGALLFRISPSGSAFVLYDSPLEEMKSLTVDRYGMIYAAALAASKDSPAIPSTSEEPSKAPKNGNLDEDKPASEEGTLRVAGTGKGQKLEIYRIDKDNLVEKLYTSNEELAFDLLVRSDGQLLVGTGNKGRIVAVDSRRFVTLLVQSPEEQITQLLEVEGKIFAATSNLGKVFQLLPQQSAKGVYESKALDAKMTSAWGMIRWVVKNPGTTPIMVYTRSGNTETPDQTWTTWNGPYQDGRGSYVQSPAARYLQWKIEFPEGSRSATVISDTNAVEQVTLSYMQRNMAPQVTSITIHPPGMAFIRYPVTTNAGGMSPGGPDRAHARSLPRSIRELDRQPSMPPPRKVFQPGTQSISWTAEDPNDDNLVYSVHYRGQDESNWKLLEKDLTEAHYTIDAVSFPDGVYLVKVTASDRPSNPAGQSVESELIGKPFIITNSSPSVELAAPQIQGQKVTVKFTARTTASTVYQAEYSVDGSEWSILFPEDKIADSYSEQYGLNVENLSPGEHSIAVRVVDSVGNIGTGKTTVSIK